MTGYFARKPNTIEDVKAVIGYGKPQPIKVVADVELSKEQYKAFTENMSAEYDFISAHTNNTGVADGFMRCILVRKAGTKRKAIAVESDGYNYARYAALVNC